MSSISNEQLITITNAVTKIAKKYKVVGICLYGSRVAGYSHANSDFDVIIVLEDYPYALKYIYAVERGIKISALVVDHQRFEKDAASAVLGEFVVGRLLHIYRPIENKELFERIEVVYKKRVILDEIYNIVKLTSVLSTQIHFPLEYIMFSKIRSRSILYPNATYSFYQTYMGKNSQQNIKFALNGYQEALKEILASDKELLVTNPYGRRTLQISESRLDVKSNHKVVTLKLTKKLQQFSSYFIHAYAGRHTLRHVLSEAESKVSRHKTSRIKLPYFISNPKESYWDLPEGLIFVDDKDWLGKIAKDNGFSKYVISKRQVLGTRNASTSLYVLTDPDNQNTLKPLVIKDMNKSGWLTWTGLHALSAAHNRSKGDALFRLGTEYRALRYVRSLGLHTPEILSVVLGKRILVTQFVEGDSVAKILDQYLTQKVGNMDLCCLNVIGEQFAKVHSCYCTFGNIKPNNLILSQNRIYYTGFEEFGFNAGHAVWDIINFMSHALKNTTNISIGMQMLDQFFEGDSNSGPMRTHKNKLVEIENYLKLFSTTLDPRMAAIIRKKAIDFVN